MVYTSLAVALSHLKTSVSRPGCAQGNWQLETGHWKPAPRLRAVADRSAHLAGNVGGAEKGKNHNEPNPNRITARAQAVFQAKTL